MLDRRSRPATLLVLLMLASSLAPLLSPASAQVATWEGESHPSPMEPGGEVNLTTDGFTLPANATITGGSLEVSTDWTQAGGNGSGWIASDPVSNFTTGVHSYTTQARFNGALSLSPDQSVGSREGFENLLPTFLDWYPGGADATIWAPSDLNLGGNLTNTSNGTGQYNSSWGGIIPTNSTEGVYVASTLAGAPLPAGSFAWLKSPEITIPAVVNGYKLRMDHWLDLSAGGAWVEYSLDNSAWRLLELDGGYPSSMDSRAPAPLGSGAGFNAFTGEGSQGWMHEIFSLDNLQGIDNSSQIRLRLVIWTEPDANTSEPGWFVDNITLTNVGEPLACWFHGNLNGPYANDANAWVEMNFSTVGLNVPMELSFAVDWDLEGGYNDNLIVEASTDHQNWAILSLPPGIPGVGLIINGQGFGDESRGWQEIAMPFLSAFSNSSQVWLRFRVQTDYAVGYGGTTNGWEGVMIDDVFISGITPNGTVTRLLDNFTSNTSVSIANASGAANQWQFLTSYGHNGPQSSSFSFENTVDLPLGWHLNHVRGGTAWQAGTTNNGSGWGPGHFPTGVQGAAVNLYGRYQAETLTVLETTDWNIPANAKASMVFMHWMCSEANWDGGLVTISADGGNNWANFGQNELGFYDALSTSNPFSPLYNLSIFDGSNIPGGCGGGQAWEEKRANLTDWAGQSVRFRFTFFSDQYIEQSGWYIDDVGVEVDYFEPEGYWQLPQINAGPLGYGTLTISGTVPDNTSVTASILSPDGTLFWGWQDRGLPLDIGLLDAGDEPSIIIRLNLKSTNPLNTPVLQRVHVGSNVMMTAENHSASGWGLMPWSAQLEWNQTEQMWESYNTATSVLYQDTFLHRPALSINVSCDCSDVSISLQTSSNQGFTNTYFTQYMANPGTIHVNSNTLDRAQKLSWRITVLSQGWLKDFYADFQWAEVGSNIAIDIKQDGVVDWEHEFVLGVVNEHSPGTPSTVSLVDGQTQTIWFAIPAGAVTTCGWVVIDVVTSSSTSMYYQTGAYSRSSAGSESGLRLILCGTSVDWHYKFKATATGDSAVVTIRQLAIPYSLLSTVDLSSDMLANLSQGMPVDEDTGKFTVPVSINSDGGGFSVDGAITWNMMVTDELGELPGTIYPDGSQHTVDTEHTHLYWDGEIENVTFSIGFNRNPQEAEVVFEAYNLVQNASWRQLRGAEKATLESVTIINSGSAGTFSRFDISWTFTPHYEWRDQPTLWWMVESRTPVSEALGPTAKKTGGSSGPAVMIDFETVRLNVIGAEGRDLDDQSDSHHPWPVKSGTTLSVSGFSRFSGSADLPTPIDDAEVWIDVVSLAGNSDWNLSVRANLPLNGDWYGAITLPANGQEGLSSGDMLGLRARLAPINGAAGSPVIDITPRQQWVRMIWDANGPSIGELVVKPPGGEQPADGHIWYSNRELALAVNISDGERLGEELNLHYWLSEEDDINSNGFADAGEYRVISEQLSQGAYTQVVDFPLIEVFGALPQTSPSQGGKVSLWLSSQDLAGNPLLGGGGPGLGDDLATVTIVFDSPTDLYVEDLALTLHQGKLFPGVTNTFTTRLADANGIESIDRFELDLTGTEDGDTCLLEWRPWNGQLEFDDWCFLGTPSVQVESLGLREWEVNFLFQLDWGLSHPLSNDNWIPSLTLYDLDQDMGLGTSRISPLQWTYSSDLEVILLNVFDLDTPRGGMADGALYISENDSVEMEVEVRYSGTEITASNLPPQIILEGRSNGGVAEVDTQSTLPQASARTNITMTFPSTAFPNDQLIVDFTLVNAAFIQWTGATLPVILDDERPRLHFDPNSLSSVRTDRMHNLPVSFEVSEAQHMGDAMMEIHWAFLRSGVPLTGAYGMMEAPLGASSGSTWIYDTMLTLNLDEDVRLENTDVLTVWVEGSDLAGNTLLGQGNQASPLIPVFTVYRFDPQIQSISDSDKGGSNQKGQINQIGVLIANEGLMPGNATLQYWVNGELVDEVNVTIGAHTSVWVYVQFEVWEYGAQEQAFFITQTGSTVERSVSFSEQVKDPVSQWVALGSSIGLVLIMLLAAIVIIMRGRSLSVHPYYTDEPLKEYEDSFLDAESEE